MINGQIFRDAVISAAYNITNQRDAVNALNVFPVPDGDTGTNMSLTMKSTVKEIAALDVADGCAVNRSDTELWLKVDDRIVALQPGECVKENAS